MRRSPLSRALACGNHFFDGGHILHLGELAVLVDLRWVCIGTYIHIGMIYGIIFGRCVCMYRRVHSYVCIGVHYA